MDRASANHRQLTIWTQLAGGGRPGEPTRIRASDRNPHQERQMKTRMTNTLPATMLVLVAVTLALGACTTSLEPPRWDPPAYDPFDSKGNYLEELACCPAHLERMASTITTRGH